MDDALANQNFEYYLEPGYIYFSKAPVTIRTVVGSCVCICLWDRNLKYGGMNHFAYPVIRDPGKATPLYGNVATAALIDMMSGAGCMNRDIVAQVTGGASPDDGNASDLGEQNVEVAKTLLDRRGLSISSEDTGGNMGRKIVFDTSTGQLVTLKVHHLRSEDWIGGLRLENSPGVRRPGHLETESEQQGAPRTESEDQNV